MAPVTPHPWIVQDIAFVFSTAFPLTLGALIVATAWCRGKPCEMR